MKLPLRGSVATRKLHAFAGVGALCFKVWLPAPRRGFPRKLCWVQILQMAYADYFIQGEINRRVLDAARIPGVGAHTKWGNSKCSRCLLHNQARCCGMAQISPFGVPIPACDPAIGAFSSVNPNFTSGIRTPSGLIFVWHTVSLADHIVYRGYPAQGGTKLRNGLRASCYSRLRGGKLGPLGRHFVARL